MTERPYAAPVTRLNDLLIEVGAWIDSRFPDDTIERRGLILAEETGEIVRCILKAAQQIRGGSDHWNDQLPDEVGDGLISLLGICHRAGIDVDQAIALRWREVRQRTYPTTHSDHLRRFEDVESDEDDYVRGLRDACHALLHREAPSWLEAN